MLFYSTEEEMTTGLSRDELSKLCWVDRLEEMFGILADWSGKDVVTRLNQMSQYLTSIEFDCDGPDGMAVKMLKVPRLQEALDSKTEWTKEMKRDFNRSLFDVCAGAQSLPGKGSPHWPLRRVKLEQALQSIGLSIKDLRVP